MMENVLSDSELIYYIRQKNKEAYRLLFLKYKTRMKHFLNIYNLLFLINRDYDAVEGIYYSSIDLAINGYEYSKGKFYSYLSMVFRYQVFIFLNKNYYHIKNEFVENSPEYLFQCEDHHQIDISLALDKLKAYDFSSYQVIKLWMNGFKYTQISEKLNIKTKKVYYLFKKGVEYLKSIMVNVSSF